MPSKQMPIDAESFDSFATESRAILFDARGRDRELSLDEIVKLGRQGNRQLLWVDVSGHAKEELPALAERLSLPEEAIAFMQSAATNPELRNSGSFFWVRVVAVAQVDGLEYSGAVLTILGGANVVVTCHERPLGFLEEIRTREAGDTELGRLSAASFIASILDWHLSTYFDAVATFEVAVERVEVELLSERDRNCLVDLRALRKGASRLRRMLAPHRVVFSSLSRPDFRPQESGIADAHFLAIDDRFERAMDIVENARDLVIGSFELFSSKNTLATNAQMRVLTFVTVVIGVLAVLAGVLGMNFDAPFFKSAGTGFWVAVGSMLFLLLAAFSAARLKRWI